MRGSEACITRPGPCAMRMPPEFALPLCNCPGQTASLCDRGRGSRDRPR